MHILLCAPDRISVAMPLQRLQLTCFVLPGSDKAIGVIDPASADLALGHHHFDCTTDATRTAKQEVPLPGAYTLQRKKAALAVRI
jgi:hypothetical protein